jgi:hypothetical protein
LELLTVTTNRGLPRRYRCQIDVAIIITAPFAVTAAYVVITTTAFAAAKQIAARHGKNGRHDYHPNGDNPYQFVKLLHVKPP